MAGNSIGDEGLAPFSAALSVPTPIETLNLSSNNIVDRLVNGSIPFQDFCRAVALSLLTTLDLTGNFFGDHGMEKLLTCVESRKSEWSSGRAPPLKLLIPERANNEVFDAIWKCSAQMGQKAKKGKKGGKKKK